MKKLNEFLIESLDREQSFEANWLVENPTKQIDKKSGRKYLDGLANAIQYYVFPKELKDDIKQLESRAKNNEPVFRTAIDLLVNSNWYVQLRQFSVDEINGHNHLVWDDDLGNKMYFDPKDNKWHEMLTESVKVEPCYWHGFDAWVIDRFDDDVVVLVGSYSEAEAKKIAKLSEKDDPKAEEYDIVCISAKDWKRQQ